jgi:putative glutamine amidotransferase
MRPVIGITVSQYPEYEGIKLRRDYTRVIEMAGGLPCLLPGGDEELVADYLQQLDGLLLTGGGDFAPEHFGELPEPVAGDFEPERDIFELALIRGAWEKGLPILAICRGMQGLNIALGGSIYQDLRYAGFERINHRQAEDMKKGSHPVHISDERLADLLGEDIVVNSSHHQAIKRLAPDFVPAALAPDGVIEAMVARDSSHYAVGLQWHPEALLPISGIFRDFVDFIKYLKASRQAETAEAQAETQEQESDE